MNNIENIDETRRNSIVEIKEKVKSNPKYLHPTNKERLEDMKELEFESGNSFTQCMQNNGIMKNPTRIEKEDKAKRHGFDNVKDFEIHEKQDKEKRYENFCQALEDKYGKEFADWARYNKSKAADAWLNLGCKTIQEYDRRIKEWRHKNGNLSMQENKNCTAHVGICIGEKISEPILIEIFGGIDKIMSYGYPDYDYIVIGGYKVDIKTANIVENNVDELFYESWDYHIKYNQIADYFLLLTFDNLDNKKLIHIWLIEKNSIIRGKLIKEFDHLKIMNSPLSIEYFVRYDYINKLKHLVK